MNGLLERLKVFLCAVIAAGLCTTLLYCFRAPLSDQPYREPKSVALGTSLETESRVDLEAAPPVEPLESVESVEMLEPAELFEPQLDTEAVNREIVRQLEIRMDRVPDPREESTAAAEPASDADRSDVAVKSLDVNAYRTSGPTATMEMTPVSLSRPAASPIAVTTPNDVQTLPTEEKETAKAAESIWTEVVVPNDVPATSHYNIVEFFDDLPTVGQETELASKPVAESVEASVEEPADELIFDDVPSATTELSPIALIAATPEAQIAAAMENTNAAPNVTVVELPEVTPPAEVLSDLPEEQSPVAETPVVETPVVETPVAETPVAETPVVETPVVEVPVAQSPVAQVPVTQAPVAQPTNGFDAAANECWFVSSDHLNGASSSDPENLYFWKAGGNLYEPSDFAAFLSSGRSDAVTVIVIHGNLADQRTALEQGTAVCQRLELIQRQRGIATPFRLIIWKWPSEKTFKGVRPDSQFKASLADANGTRLAALLSRLPAESPVAMIGFSFGARTAGSALELLAGGTVQGTALPSEQLAASASHRYRLLLLASAANYGDFGVGGKYALGTRLLSNLWEVYNPTDKALKFYPLLYKGSRATAMGVSPMNGAALPENLRGRAWSVNASYLGPEHDFYQQLSAIGLERLAHLVFDELP